MEQVEAFLGIPLWHFVSIIIAILAFVVPIFVYRLQRKRKTLSYDVISTTPLLNIEEEEEGKLKILFENKQVLDPYMVMIIVFNSGNVSISKTDYDEQVSFLFKAEKVLSAKVIETDPKTIKAKVDVSQNKVALNPILLNGGDFIVLKVFLEKYEDGVDVDGRIVGVKNIQQLKLNKKRNRRYNLMVAEGLVSTIVGLFCAFYGMYHHLLVVAAMGIMVSVTGYFLVELGRYMGRITRKMAEA